MPSEKRYDANRPSWTLRVGAFAGLAFMHIPVFVIILYAFTTEDRTYQFPPPGFTLHWFEVAFARSDIWQSLGLSLASPPAPPSSRSRWVRSRPSRWQERGFRRKTH